MPHPNTQPGAGQESIFDLGKYLTDGVLADASIRWSDSRVCEGHLFLALMADGGIYEFEPVARPKP